MIETLLLRLKTLINGNLRCGWDRRCSCTINLHKSSKNKVIQRSQSKKKKKKPFNVSSEKDKKTPLQGHVIYLEHVLISSKIFLTQ